MREPTKPVPARRKRARDRKHESDALRAALESLPQGLCTFDQGGRLLLANRRYRDMLGLPAGAIMPGMRLADLIAAECAAGHHEGRALTDLLAERQMLADGDEVPLRLADSPDGPRLAQAACRRIEGGGFILSVEDVTAARATEARTAAAARLVSLGEMAAGMAHELKQPLTAIALATANAERAMGRGDLANLQVRLTRIGAQAERAGALIDHLRRFARGWDEQATLEEVALGEPIEGALLLVGGALREAQVTVEHAMPARMPVVRGHRMAIEQVVMNLLANAHDALEGTPPGHARRIRIAVDVPADDGVAVLTVADTAGGIPDRIMQRLFEPFSTTKGPERGTGLGLSICQGLVRSMGGTIAAENAAEGAVFTIRLRLADIHADGPDAAASTGHPPTP